MTKARQSLLLLIGCVVFMLLALGVFALFDIAIGISAPYLLAAIANLIGFVGHGITSAVIGRMSKVKEKICPLSKLK